MHQPSRIDGAPGARPDAPNPLPHADALRALGWRDDVDAALRGAQRESPAPLVPARVLVAHRDRWIVDDGAREGGARLATALRGVGRTAPDARPTVGDWVAVAPSADRDGTIHAVLPRFSAFVRRAAGAESVPQVVAANVDVALVVEPVPPNGRRLERYLALAWESGAEPVVVLTKCDLADAGAGGLDAVLVGVRALAPGARVVATSALTGDGLDALADVLRPGCTAVLLGVSGAGKSTLVNHLAGHARMRTGPVRDDGKGRHTTTHRELVRLPGGALLIDTPGMRELQLWDADDGLARAFGDVTSLAASCRFADCAHASEPGCAVRAAVASGAIPAERLESWRALARELAWQARRADARAQAGERARVRTLTRSMRAHLRDKGR